MQIYCCGLFPIFYLMIIIEIVYGHYKKNQTYKLMDTIASLSSGSTNLLKDILGLTLIIISYPFLLTHLSFFQIESNFWVYLIAFICGDFSSYWNHRLNHTINIFGINMSYTIVVRNLIWLVL